MLTRKDFKAMAAKIAAIQDAKLKMEEFKKWGGIFENSNPRFNWGRFRLACKVDNA